MACFRLHFCGCWGLCVSVGALRRWCCRRCRYGAEGMDVKMCKWLPGVIVVAFGLGLSGCGETTLHAMLQPGDAGNWMAWCRFLCRICAALRPIIVAESLGRARCSLRIEKARTAVGSCGLYGLLAVWRCFYLFSASMALIFSRSRFMSSLSFCTLRFISSIRLLPFLLEALRKPRLFS